MNQPRFLGSRDDARANARLLHRRLEELAAVFGFADGARGDGNDLVDAVRVGQSPEFRQHLERGVHGLRGQCAAVEPARAQPDHFLFAVDDFEGQIGADAHDDHVQRVGADVDGGQAHASTIIKVSLHRLFT